MCDGFFERYEREWQALERYSGVEDGICLKPLLDRLLVSRAELQNVIRCSARDLQEKLDTARRILEEAFAKPAFSYRRYQHLMIQVCAYERERKIYILKHRADRSGTPNPAYFWHRIELKLAHALCLQQKGALTREMQRMDLQQLCIRILLSTLAGDLTDAKAAGWSDAQQIENRIFFRLGKPGEEKKHWFSMMQLVICSSMLREERLKLGHAPLEARHELMEFMPFSL